MSVLLRHPSIRRSFERGSEQTTERFRRVIREERERDVMWHFWPSEIEPNLMDEILRWDIFDDDRNNFDIDSSLEEAATLQMILDSVIRGDT